MSLLTLAASLAVLGASQSQEPTQLKATAPERKPYPWMARIADDAPVVACCIRHGGLNLYHARTGEVLKSLEDPVPGAEVWRIDIDASGDLVALLTRDNRVLYWRFRGESGPEVVATLPGALSTWTKYRFGAVLEFAPGGERLLVGHPAGGVLMLDRTGETVAQFSSSSAEPADRSVGGEWRAIRASGFDIPRSWSRDGDRLALVANDGPIVVDAETGKTLASGFSEGNMPVESMALSADARYLAVGRHGGTVTLHDAEAQEELWTYQFVDSFLGAHDPAFNPLGIGDLEFSPDGSLIAATTTTGIHGVLLDAESGEQRWSGPHCGGRMGEPSAVAWTPDGKGFYHAYVSGVMPLQHVRLEADRRHGFAGRIQREVGTLPDIGWEGIGVYVHRQELCATEASGFREVWRDEIR